MAEPDFSSRWWQIAALRSLLDAAAARGRALGHHFGPDSAKPDFAFLAVESGGATRSVVVLRSPAAVITFVAAADRSAGVPQVNGPTTSTPIESMDLAGVRVGDWAVLFNIEPRATRGAVWFDTGVAQRVRMLVTGLAPGQWDVWRDGWLVEQGMIVRPTAGALYFAHPGGTYFLRPVA